MKRSVIVSALVMLLLPWLTVTFAPGDAGMAICMLLFYGANPLYALWAGWSAGANVRKMWSIPVTTAAFFLIGAWIFFDAGEPLFAAYALVYLCLGLAAMGLSAFVRK